MLKSKLLKLILVVFVGVFVLSGCTSFDSESYVANQLDARFKAEYDAAAKDTDDSIDVYKKLRDKELDESVSLMTRSMVASGMSFNEEQKGELKDLLDNLYKQVNYEVVSSEKSGDDYKVTIKVKPLTNLKSFESEVGDQKALEKFMKKNNITSQSKLRELLPGYILDVLKNTVKEPKYGDEKDITVTVVKGTDKTYSVSDTDLRRLAEGLVQQ